VAAIVGSSEIFYAPAGIMHVGSSFHAKVPKTGSRLHVGVPISK
jgi:hypothetical protein